MEILLCHNGCLVPYSHAGELSSPIRVFPSAGLFSLRFTRVEKVSDEVIAKCHQCGTPFDIHTNCANDACHLLFIQCDNCKSKMKNCCSYACLEISEMPYEVQKKLRKGQKNSNDIFKKGRTSNITTFDN